MAVFEFAPFRLDTLNQCLWRRTGVAGNGDERIPLPPTGFGVLRHLVEHAGQLVSEEALLEAVWPGIVVEPQAVKNRVFAIRKSLGDSVKTPRFIETLHRRGYRFIAPVSLQATSDAASGAQAGLPEQAGSFIGRTKEIAELKALLAGTRLLTLTGAGGCGKTRLAVRVASEASASFVGGLWLAELAAQADARFVAQTVAGALRLKEQPGKALTQTIAEFLASRQALLVLDNAEHVLPACASLAETLLRECPRLTILVTSREPLGVAGEHVYRVPSLPVPAPAQERSAEGVLAFESVCLFADRARLQRPHFTVTDENAPSLASICRRLDGIPLAIELAAARVRSMPVHEVNRRLHQRLGLLTGGSLDAPRRHHTLRAAIDWSFDLLGAAEQALFCGLSVFAGGWSLASAEAVCTVDDSDDVLELLGSLADKSLIVSEEREGETRWRMLETLRQYARGQLAERGQETEWRRRHLDHFLALAEEAKPHYFAAGQTLWLRRIETEHDNLQAALAWAIDVEHDAFVGVRMAEALFSFWFKHGHGSIGRSWYAKVLSGVPGSAAKERSQALHGAGVLARLQGDFPTAEALLEESLSLRRQLGNPTAIAAGLASLANVLLSMQDNLRALPLLEESLQLQRELGDAVQIGILLNNIGGTAYLLGDHQRAWDLRLESLALHRQLSDQDSVAFALNNLGVMARDKGELATARAFHEKGIAIWRELGNRWGVGIALNNLANVVFAEGDAAAALELARESLSIRHEQNDRWGMAWSFEGIAGMRAAFDPAGAARLWAHAERLREEIKSPLPPLDAGTQGQRVAIVRAVLGDDFEEAWHAGRAMGLAEAVALAMGEGPRSGEPVT